MPASSTPACQPCGTAASRPGPLTGGPRRPAITRRPCQVSARSRARTVRQPQLPDGQLHRQQVALRMRARRHRDHPGRHRRPAAGSSIQRWLRGQTARSCRHSLPAKPHQANARLRTAAGDPAASAGHADSDPAVGWPARGPRTAREPASPGRQTRHEADASHQATGGPVTAAEAEPGGNRSHRHPAAPGADWRDHIIGQARQSWQPGPGWPGDPALRRPPEAAAPDAGIRARPMTQPGRPDLRRKGVLPKRTGPARMQAGRVIHRYAPRRPRTRPAARCSRVNQPDRRTGELR